MIAVVLLGAGVFAVGVIRSASTIQKKDAPYKERLKWYAKEAKTQGREKVTVPAPLVEYLGGSIWFVGGGTVSGECLRRGLADKIRYSILPILIVEGIPFFEKLDKDVILHLAEVKAYNSGIVELRYDVRGSRGKSHDGDGEL